MDSGREELERLLSPLQTTLEIRGDDGLGWSRAHVTLRMGMWWFNHESPGKMKKNIKLRLKERLGRLKGSELGTAPAVLWKNENDWRNADGYFPLVRNKDSQSVSRVELENSGERRSFKVSSNGEMRIFRALNAREAAEWKQAIEMRLMSWENLLGLGVDKFRELVIPQSESGPSASVEDNHSRGGGERGKRKAGSMVYSGLILKGLDAALNGEMNTEQHSRGAIDVINLLRAAPYVGYALRVVGFGLELTARLAEESRALEKAQELLKKILENALRALVYAMRSSDGIGFYDFLSLIEKCEEAGHHLEFYVLGSTATKVKVLGPGKRVWVTEMISQLQDLHDDLQRDLSLNIYRSLVVGSAKGSSKRKRSDGLSKNVSAVTPWPDEILLSDSGRYVENPKLLAQISYFLVNSRASEVSRKGSSMVQKCILSGPSGIGKTELVKQYARKKRGFYKGGVYWVQAEKHCTLLESFKAIREQIRVFAGYGSVSHCENGQKTQAGALEVRTQVKADCENFFHELGGRKGPWLIIFDNADKINGDKDFRVDWMPRTGVGNVLVTTRVHAEERKLHTFREACSPMHLVDPLKNLEVAKASALLLLCVGRGDEEPHKEKKEWIQRIVGSRNLDGYPLAIVQAGHYLKETSVSLMKYAELLDSSDVPEVMFSDEDEQVPEKRILLKTFLPLKEKLSDSAKELLSILCWLSPDGIAERDLWKCADPSINMFQNSSLQEHFGDTEDCSDDANALLMKKKWIKLMKEISMYGLVQRVRKGGEIFISAHPLVYTVERDILKDLQEGTRLNPAIVTAIMLLQYHLKTKESRSKTIPSLEYHDKGTYVAWDTAQQCAQLESFREEYSTFRYNELPRFYRHVANLEHADAMYDFGVLYELGVGVGRDRKRAAELYGMAANLNQVDAMRRLGILYRDGGGGVEKDEMSAVELFEKAVKLEDTGAMSNLAVLHMDGAGVAKDETRAAELFEKAVSLRDARAMNDLGVLYETGSGVKKNKKHAARLYAMAVDRGHTTAMQNLGRLYKIGKGVKKDERRAAELFSEARYFTSAAQRF